jgi:DNA-binding LacI/PurR family transcriptional regulator
MRKEKLEDKKTKPIYLKMAEELEQKIRAKYYQPGEKLPSVEELALKDNVHKNTVKSAFKTLREKGLVRNYSGVGIVVKEDLKFPLKAALILPVGFDGLKDVILGIYESLNNYDASMDIMLYETSEEQSEYLKCLNEKDYSGAIIRADFSGNGNSFVRRLQDEKYPIVLIENFYSDSKGWNVDAGSSDACAMAVEHFHRERREPIALVCPNDKFGDGFMEGYKKAHLKLKINCLRNNIKRFESGSSAGKASVELMKIKNPPRSIIYTSARDAIDGCKALKEHGKDLRYIKLLSFGENLAFELLEHPIISIKRDLKELGRKAGMLLAEQISGASNHTPQRNEKVKIEFKS